jgi:PAS domain S-box-containing protein
MTFFFWQGFKDASRLAPQLLGQMSLDGGQVTANSEIALALGLVTLVAIAQSRRPASPPPPSIWLPLAAVTGAGTLFQLLQIPPVGVGWPPSLGGISAALALLGGLGLLWVRWQSPRSASPEAPSETKMGGEQSSLSQSATATDPSPDPAAADPIKAELEQREHSTRVELAAALENLQATAERLNIALSTAQMGSWDWDLATQQQYCTPKTMQILGVPQSAHDELDWVQQVHPEDLPRVEAAIAQAQTTQQNLSEECRVLWPDGSVHWVLIQGRVLCSLTGMPQRMIGVMQEITAAKQANMTLRLNEARFRAVFEQAAVGMARLSPDGQWLQVNQTLCQLLGYTAGELIGQPFQAITDPADHDQDAHYYQQLVASKIPACRFEKRYLHRDGSPIWTMVTVSTERDDDDQIVAFIAVIEDIRTLKQTRSELQQRATELEQVNGMLAMTTAMLESRNAELDQFAYVASHDLKAPLRAIANLSEWIEEDLGDRLPEENQHQLILLRQRVHRMEALINGLLEYSRVGRREPQLETVDVAALLHDIIDSLSPPETFTLSLVSKMPTLETNRVTLNQVFANLISNAVKHHHLDHGHIQISAQQMGDRIEFAVTDDGPGIAPQYHDKIFTIFQTLKSRDQLESTGIGLAVVKKIIQSTGGTIAVESTLGAGTTFRFTWPQGAAQDTESH